MSATETATTFYGIWRKDVNQNRGDWLRELDDVPTAGIIVFTSIRQAQRRAYEMYGFKSYREVTRKDWAEVRPLVSTLNPRAKFIAAFTSFLDDSPGGLIGKKQLRDWAERYGRDGVTP